MPPRAPTAGWQTRSWSDGSWWRSYREGQPDNPDRRESNYVAYVATGVWHHYLITGDMAFLQELFPVIDAAMGFVLKLQGEAGEIDWAVDASGAPMGDASGNGLQLYLQES